MALDFLPLFNEGKIVRDLWFVMDIFPSFSTNIVGQNLNLLSNAHPLPYPSHQSIPKRSILKLSRSKIIPMRRKHFRDMYTLHTDAKLFGRFPYRAAKM